MKAQGINKPRTKRYVVVLTAKQEKARKNMPDGMRQGFDKGVEQALKEGVANYIKHIPEIVESVRNKMKRDLTESIEQTNKES